MKIKSISVFNVGPYKNRSTFDFASNNKQNISLIGGKNGAGKTTLFKAIQFCLYGAKALGYEVNNQYYFKEIKKIININNLLISNSPASVSVKLSLENSTDCDDYTVVREWIIVNDKINESFNIYHAERKLNGIEIADFENLMMQLIPPDLFNFYFFNGEKIFDMLFDENSISNFKTSFIKIIGLDSIELLIDNFEKHAVEKSINKKLVAEYSKIHDKYKKVKDEKKRLEVEISLLQSEVKSLELELSQAKKKYSKNNVLTLSERSLLEKELKELEEKRDKMRRVLKDAGNNFIPFLILREEIKRLEKKISVSKASVTPDELQSVLMSPITLKYLKSNIKDEIHPFIEGLIKTISESDGNTIIHLSSSDKQYLLEQISHILADDRKNEIIELEKNYIASLNRCKEIRIILEENSGERNDEYNQFEIDINNKIISLQKSIESLYKQLGPVLDKFGTTHLAYTKIKEQYEAELKKESVSSISYNASASFKKLRDQIVSNKISLLKKNFIDNFNLLINKSDLVSGIEVEPDLSVYPYKEITLSNLEAKNMLKTSNNNLLIEQYGEDGFYAIKNVNNHQSVKVKKKILGTMSAGESQIYVIALYMSMISLSHVNIPLIIDTPFGRIDEIHRTNIIDNFLKRINNQTIILSTDEEIVGNLYERIKDKVCTEYTISNSEGSGTSIVRGYFKEVAK